MRGIILILSIILSLLMHGVAFAETVSQQSAIDALGTHFAVTDSAYLDFSLVSSEPITLRMESVPNIITIVTDASTSFATTTTITMSGFLPITTYYKYTDSYHNLTTFIANENGVYVYTQDISVPHIIFIQPHKSTKFIRADATGGDCATIGIWNSTTLSCTLTQNLFETVQIDSDNITLDGNNFTISGFHTGSGVYLNGRSDVTIKNLQITNFSYGISVYNANNIHIEHNNFINNDSQAIVLSNSVANTITGNRASLLVPSRSRRQGFVLYNSHDNSFRDNTIALNARASLSGGHQGILLFSSNNNSFTGNDISDTYQGVLFFGSNNNSVRENTIRDNQNTGLMLFSPATGNQVYNNNFLNNGTHAVNYAGAGNVFNMPNPNGGNYWDTFDTPAEGCSDANTDGFCDAPRIFTSGQDNRAWTVKDGWKTLVSHAPTLSFATTAPHGLYEDDGIQDHKGTAGKTHLTFSVIYTDVANRAPENMSATVVPEFDVGNPVPLIPTIMALTQDTTTASTTLKDGDYRNGELFAYYHPLTFSKHTYSYSFSAFVNGATTTVPTATENQFSFKTGYSNVLFLPGIMGSRLYWTDPSCLLVNCENKLWIPNRNDDVEKLYMATGTSVLSNIYTKEDDILLEGPFGSNFYKVFADDMNGMVASGTIEAWKPIAYDWRYGNDHLLSGGLNIDGKIYYDVPTSFPYILEELSALVASSRTGKVTIVAHSNGGLLAKALIQKLKDSGMADLVDNLMLVASPQLGTPQAIGALLHGYDASGLKYYVGKSAQRKLAHDMPMTYNLLPSEKYLSTISTPVTTFDEDVPAHALWGDEINSTGEYLAYLLGGDSRTNPDFGELEDPAIANETLLTSALEWHANFDDWVAPTTTTVYQIAGWGVDTVSGIKYSNDAWLSDFSWDYEPTFTEDGDGTVVTPSALGNDGQKYWVNLSEYKDDTGNMFDHGDIFEVPQLRTLIKNIIQKEDITDPGQYISITRPSAVNIEKRLRYLLHSPLTLELYDAQGRHVGVSTTTGQIEEQIPGASYDEFGEVKYISVPASASTTLVMRGEGKGRFTLNIQEVTGGVVTATTTFANIPVSTSTLVTMSVSEDPVLSALPGLSIDEDSDGIIDTYVSPGTVLVPDTTPPELQISFSTSTRQLQFVGLDTNSTSVVTTATSTTVTDASENSLHTPLISHKEKNRRALLSFKTLVYNGSTTTIATTTVKYKWKTEASGKFTMFAAFIKTGSTTVEAHYRSKKNQTIIMSKPADFDDSDSDDDYDNRPTKMKLQGLVIPGVQTSSGGINIIY